MKYLNFDVLNRIDAKAYREQHPFPYIDVPAPLYEDAYRLLVETAPADLSLFEKQFGIERKYGQKYHDKYFLAYSLSVPISEPWKEFIAEMESSEYRGFIEKMFNMRPGSYTMLFSWHYMPRGTCITPHCDTRTKMGSQLFYLNTPADWDSSWGGQTLALDDEGKMDWQSGPQISDFKNVFTSKSIGNTSFIFTRTDHSWHAVDVIECPDGRLRKMFSMVANRKPTLFERLRKHVRKYIPF